MHFRQLFKVLGISEAEADEEGNGGDTANESTDQADKENNGTK